MLKFILFTGLLCASSFALARSYQFDCSNAEGSIRIHSSGQKLEILGAQYIPYHNLKGLELWMNNDRDQANVEVLEEGNRTILDFYTNDCRNIRDITFAQMLRMRNINGSTSLPEDVLENFVCRELATSDSDGGCDHGL
jgi:hypothetical protein